MPAQVPHRRVEDRKHVAREGADDHHHPLHRVYRTRMRWLRMRWFSGGLILGATVGILLTLGASALVVTQFPEAAEVFSGEPDVAVVIGENYLNREAANRIGDAYATGMSRITLTALRMDISPGNRMDLQPTFSVDATFATFELSPLVKNQLSVQDGRLAINMVGDPQLGELNLPLEFLPFDLKGEITNAVNRVNNDLLLSEINQSLQAGFGGTDFEVEGVTTNDSGLTIRLKHR